MYTELKIPKKATNINLSTEVFADAKALGINISQVCEQSLREVIREEKARRWNTENAEFIRAYNAEIDANGTALQEWCSF